MLDSELRIDIIETFKILQSALGELQHNICYTDSALPIWFQEPSILNFKNTNSRENLASFLSQLEFVDAQDPKEILLGPGILACSNVTLQSINKVNIAKDNFKESMIKCKKAKIKLNDSDLNQEFNLLLDKHRPNIISKALNKMGLARLHLKQCYRKIPILNNRPSKVSWTWAHTKAIKKIDVNTAREMLIKKRQVSGIEDQIRKLETLQPNDKLAIVQELAPHLRANILTGTDAEPKRFMIKGSMPIFYLDETNALLPKHSPPSIVKKPTESSRKQRSDVKLEGAPFIPALRAHRYLEV